MATTFRDFLGLRRGQDPWEWLLGQPSAAVEVAEAPATPATPPATTSQPVSSTTLSASGAGQTIGSQFYYDPATGRVLARDQLGSVGSPAPVTGGGSSPANQMYGFDTGVGAVKQRQLAEAIANQQAMRAAAERDELPAWAKTSANVPITPDGHVSDIPGLGISGKKLYQQYLDMFGRNPPKEMPSYVAARLIREEAERRKEEVERKNFDKWWDNPVIQEAAYELGFSYGELANNEYLRDAVRDLARDIEQEQRAARMAEREAVQKRAQEYIDDGWPVDQAYANARKDVKASQKSSTGSKASSSQASGNPNWHPPGDPTGVKTVIGADQAYNQAYQTAIEAGVSEEDAKKIAQAAWAGAMQVM